MLESINIKPVSPKDVIYQCKTRKVTITADQTTCWACECNTICPYRYDAYNINGDCLAIK